MSRRASVFPVPSWVRPVREAALQAATAALSGVPLKLLVRHLPLVNALHRFRRADPVPFTQQVMDRLRQPDALAWLASHLGTLEDGSRRLAGAGSGAGGGGQHPRGASPRRRG